MQTFEHYLKTVDPNIDFGTLPEEAKRELVEFYEFLIFKYQRKRVMQPNEDTLASQSTQSPQTPSKWAKIAQRVQNDPIHLAGYAEQLKKDIKEFRIRNTILI
jgi:hypothetical protein